MTDPTEDRDHVECPACHELNRRGIRACARCGEALAQHRELGVDPELRSFNHAAADATEEERGAKANSWQSWLRLRGSRP